MNHDAIMEAQKALQSAEYDTPAVFYMSMRVWLVINGYVIVNRRGRNKLKKVEWR